MITYTIATYYDWFLACAPDGDDRNLQEQIEHENIHGRLDLDPSELKYESGLTLCRTMDDVNDAVDAGAELVFIWGDVGGLEDADGDDDYVAAVRMPATKGESK